MPDYQNGNIPEELLKSLQSVTLLMQNLLSDIKEHSTSLAMVKAKLESLTSNVDTLSHVVRDGNGKGSMITRLALAEKSLEDFEEELHEMKGEIISAIREVKRHVEKDKESAKKEVEDEKSFNRKKTIERMKTAGLLVPGIIALIMELFKIFGG